MDSLRGYRFELAEPSNIRARRRASSRDYYKSAPSSAYWVMICPSARGPGLPGKRVRLAPGVRPSDVVRLMAAFHE